MKAIGTILLILGYLLMASWIRYVPYALTIGTGYLDTWSFLIGVIASPILLVFIGHKLRAKTRNQAKLNNNES
jgi:hypothetical protein